MLKKLRLKFIIINMTIVTLMLAVIFGMLYYSTSRDMEEESLRSMSSLTLKPAQPMVPVPDGDSFRLPYVQVFLNRAGEMTDVIGNLDDLSGEDELLELVTEVIQSPTSTGVVKEYNLRYSRTDTPLGQSIVFADMTFEQFTLKSLIRTFAVIGSAAFLVFLGISILLSRWAVKPVAKAWQQQRQFVADASHELKTPLTVIMTDAELLHSPDCPEEDRRLLSGSILTMTGQMRGLVESLLELARIDGGTVKARMETLCLSQTVSESAMLFEPVFFEKELSFRYEIEPNIMMNGIPGQLKQLTDILLDNAAKYASPGGETILKLCRSTRNECLLDVSNQGEPIAQEDLANLFKRFYRADKARKMDHSYGLGLSIAQSITQYHHGSIQAKSESGINRFIVKLPLNST